MADKLYSDCKPSGKTIISLREINHEMFKRAYLLETGKQIEDAYESQSMFVSSTVLLEIYRIIEPLVTDLEEIEKRRAV